jgi:hypothetical protein
VAQFKRDVARGDVIGLVGGVVAVVERAGRSCIMLMKVLNMMTSGQHRAEERIA